jgi:phage repressor protein C with HTH and peptisase S24 domain
MSQVNDGEVDGRGTFRAPGADKAAFVERLQTILLHWPSADRLAREMKVSPSALRKWLKGEAEPSRERLVALARAAGVDIAWLAEGAGAQPNFKPPAGVVGREPDGKADWGRFVLLRAAAAISGNGFQAQDIRGGFIAVRQDWVRSVCQVDPDKLAVETATDDAMAPSIPTGAILLVDTTEQPTVSFGIYVLQVNERRIVRRVQARYDGGMMLTGDHPACQPDLVSAADAKLMKIVGRVVWSGSKI